ncbi:unnamed protein product [Trichobilharzia regenti]|nr:unnamed protein product [Trichobilharzia regenti]
MKSELRTAEASFCDQLLESSHLAQSDSSFKVIHMAKSNRSKSLRFLHLCIAEALAIHEQKPKLCVQKHFVKRLSLPWS